ncbi:MAG TPA: farnesyl diphosphate synthase [Xanthobacteraceae bacterium]|nr:farnesyl diphosphate synthase [Xanthobacteraceae bacterium]
MRARYSASQPRASAQTAPSNADAQFTARLAAAARATERLLDGILSRRPARGEIARPSRLIEAMRYATLGGGKRLRPLLVLESAALFGVPRRRALTVAAAVECVHCYSLVHDDLPAMDDDVLRRGRPTLHRAFDEATAILAGDSLLALAFDLLARPQTHPDATVRVTLISELARAAGFTGMTGGQMLDLAAEGRFGAVRFDERKIAQLDGMKTGALIRFACIAGGILGKAPRSALAALSRYGEALGQAFQIADDLLDVEGDAATLGKTTGKDAGRGKATLVSALGTTVARDRLTECIAAAERALKPFGPAAATLRAAAHFVATRHT